MLRIINAEDQQVADAVRAGDPAIARAVDAIVAAIERGGRLFYIGAGTSGRLGVLDAAECPPTFSVPPEMVQGIMAGGEAALSRATETTEDDPAIGVRDLLGPRLRRARRAGGNRRERPHALCARRGRGGQADWARSRSESAARRIRNCRARSIFRSRRWSARRSSPDPRA